MLIFHGIVTTYASEIDLDPDMIYIKCRYLIASNSFEDDIHGGRPSVSF